jgi:hypothetical protein
MTDRFHFPTAFTAAEIVSASVHAFVSSRVATIPKGSLA